MSPLLVIAGTGTEIGKTIAACLLIEAWSRRGIRVAGLKPIETGDDGTASDRAALERASTFHVTRSTSPYLFGSPVSPHLAARQASARIDLSYVRAWADAIRAEADAVVLELAGGLFTPLTDHETNADLARALDPTRLILVAPNRLGVLHDLLSTTRAARAMHLHIDGLLLSDPERPDASTPSNAEELRRVLPDIPVLGVLPRGPKALREEQTEVALDALGLRP